jgi:four helix bundle protein
MERTTLEDRTQAFAAAVCRLTAQVRPCAGGPRLADQLLDCATSVGANYRATARARSRAEFVAKLGLVAEEADEAVYWLELLGTVGMGDPGTVSTLLAEAKELRAIFAAACRTARQNHRNQRQRR